MEFAPASTPHPLLYHRDVLNPDALRFPRIAPRRSSAEFRGRLQVHNFAIEIFYFFLAVPGKIEQIIGQLVNLPVRIAALPRFDIFISVKNPPVISIANSPILIEALDNKNRPFVFDNNNISVFIFLKYLFDQVEHSFTDLQISTDIHMPDSHKLLFKSSSYLYICIYL